jgi:hypothetical protein
MQNDLSSLFLFLTSHWTPPILIHADAGAEWRQSLIFGNRDRVSGRLNFWASHRLISSSVRFCCLVSFSAHDPGSSLLLRNFSHLIKISENICSANVFISSRSVLMSLFFIWSNLMNEPEVEFWNYNPQEATEAWTSVPNRKKGVK